jgi:hypothetical protein
MGNSLPAASSARQRRTKKITPLRQPDVRQNNSNTQAGQSEITDKIDLDSPELYLNRELTWLDFTGRVLSMAEDPRVPLLERVNSWRLLVIILTNFL